MFVVLKAPFLHTYLLITCTLQKQKTTTGAKTHTVEAHITRAIMKVPLSVTLKCFLKVITALFFSSTHSGSPTTTADDLAVSTEYQIRFRN